MAKKIDPDEYIRVGTAAKLAAGAGRSVNDDLGQRRNTMDGILVAVLIMAPIIALVMAVSPTPPKRRW